MNNLITIKTVMFLSDISVAMSYLEDNGIQCFLKDGNFAQVHPAATMQGIKLQVIDKDAEKAMELLKEGGFTTAEEFEEYSDPLTRFVGKVIDTFKGDKE